MQWLARSLITRPARVQFPDQEARIIRCKNVALYIRDFVSMCLSDETLNDVGPFYLGGGGKCVICRGLHKYGLFGVYITKN